MNYKKSIYWTATVLFALLMIFSAGMYFFDHQNVIMNFKALGYPMYLVTPLGVLKIIGIIALVIPGYKQLKDWAYAGFTINLGLAVVAHAFVGDGEWMAAVMGLFFLITSFIYKKYRN